MQNFRQQNGPAVTAMAHVKPVMHGDSGTRSQSLSAVHSAVHRPLLIGCGLPPGGGGRFALKCRQVRDTQSSEGDATTSVSTVGVEAPRSQSRPTGLSEHPEPPNAATAPTHATERQTTSTPTGWRRFIAPIIGAGDPTSSERPHTTPHRGALCEAVRLTWGPRLL